MSTDAWQPAVAPGTRLAPGETIDGFRLGECIHQGGTGAIFRVTATDGRNPGFPIVLKAPFLGHGESPLGIVSLEMEQIVLQSLSGPHVPRFVAAGDVRAVPYLVLEWIDGEGLVGVLARTPLPAAEVARIGAALADAVHSVHRQDVVHLDLKPENFLLRPNGEAVLLDFGFACHRRYPDLLGEERQHAAGSAAYVSPEQLRGDRNDARSDLFALGVMVYELATGQTPFGEPQTLAGMRDRLWRAPPPPRALNPELPPWLQEVILRCLEVSAQSRYQSAAHIAFDLRNPDQVMLTERAHAVHGEGLVGQLGRWWRHRGERGRESAAIARLPVIMVAVDTEHPDDERHPALQRATRQLVSLYPELRLMCISVIHVAVGNEGVDGHDSATTRHLEHRERLRQWVRALALGGVQTSLHVVQGADAGRTLLELARANHVDLIVLGAPGPSERALAWWRSVASSVTAGAPCSVHVVRVARPDGEDETSPD
jgi:nucleotide-binding universal stress UspA family protein